MHDDCKIVNSNGEETKLIKCIYNRNIFFPLQEKKNMTTLKRLKENPIKRLERVSFVNLTLLLLKC